MQAVYVCSGPEQSPARLGVEKKWEISGQASSMVVVHLSQISEAPSESWWRSSFDFDVLPLRTRDRRRHAAAHDQRHRAYAFWCTKACAYLSRSSEMAMRISVLVVRRNRHMMRARRSSTDSRATHLFMRWVAVWYSFCPMCYYLRVKLCEHEPRALFAREVCASFLVLEPK